MFYKKIIGERIYLSPMDMTQYEKYTEWMNDSRIALGLGNFTTIFNEEVGKEALEKLQKETYLFAIVTLDENKFIGTIRLYNMKKIDKNCEMGIFIGDEENRNKGYGKEATALILDFAFNYLNMHSIVLGAFSFNKMAINSYLSLGFKHAGIFRDHKYIMGKYYDAVFMDILKKDFVNSKYNNCIKLNLCDIEKDKELENGNKI